MKDKKRWIAFAINMLFLTLTIYYGAKYITFYTHELTIKNSSIFYIGLIALMTIVVHTMKALRLYVLLFGKKFRLSKFLFTYARTTVVNILLPFKSGELYRGYCVGNLIDSYAEGYVIVIFDRFIDTLALMMVVLLSGLLVGFEITLSYLVLFAFLILLVLIYWIFEPLYDYWNHFLVFNKKSVNTLRGLKFLQVCKLEYMQILKVVRGRFGMLFLMSIIAWVIEIGTLGFLNKFFSKEGLSEYCSTILAGKMSINNISYLMASMGLLILLAVASYIYLLLKEKR
jgi:hypothetical protein